LWDGENKNKTKMQTNTYNTHPERSDSCKL
jgi:hypothetical protein